MDDFICMPIFTAESVVRLEVFSPTSDEYLPNINNTNVVLTVSI